MIQIHRNFRCFRVRFESSGGTYRACRAPPKTAQALAYVPMPGFKPANLRVPPLIQPLARRAVESWRNISTMMPLVRVLNSTTLQNPL